MVVWRQAVKAMPLDHHNTILSASQQRPGKVIPCRLKIMQRFPFYVVCNTFVWSNFLTVLDFTSFDEGGGTAAVSTTLSVLLIGVANIVVRLSHTFHARVWLSCTKVSFFSQRSIISNIIGFFSSLC